MPQARSIASEIGIMRKVTEVEKAAFILNLLIRTNMTELEKVANLLEKVNSADIVKMTEMLILVLMSRTK